MFFFDFSNVFPLFLWLVPMTPSDGPGGNRYPPSPNSNTVHNPAKPPSRNTLSPRGERDLRTTVQLCPPDPLFSLRSHKATSQPAGLPFVMSLLNWGLYIFVPHVLVMVQLHHRTPSVFWMYKNLHACWPISPPCLMTFIVVASDTTIISWQEVVHRCTVWMQIHTYIAFWTAPFCTQPTSLNIPSVVKKAWKLHEVLRWGNESAAAAADCPFIHPSAFAKYVVNLDNRSFLSVLCCANIGWPDQKLCRL